MHFWLFFLDFRLISDAEMLRHHVQHFDRSLGVLSDPPFPCPSARVHVLVAYCSQSCGLVSIPNQIEIGYVWFTQRRLVHK